jgi:two-component sensor histidine kinase
MPAPKLLHRSSRTRDDASQITFSAFQGAGRGATVRGGKAAQLRLVGLREWLRLRPISCSLRERHRAISVKPGKVVGDGPTSVQSAGTPGRCRRIADLAMASRRILTGDVEGALVGVRAGAVLRHSRHFPASGQQASPLSPRFGAALPVRAVGATLLGYRSGPTNSCGGVVMREFYADNLTALVDAILAQLRRRVPPGSFQAYAFAIACVVGATLFEVWIKWLDENASPLIAYYPAVALAALLGGIGPGALVAVLAGLTTWWVFMSPAFSFLLARHGDKITLIAFAFVSLLLVCAADYFRRLAKRLEDEEELRRLAVQELAHRLKNKIATIQAIISVQLRDQPQVRSDILDRLGALTATDHLIEEANGRGAFVRDIAETELGPYVVSRVSIRGPNVLLPPKYALTIALLIHELATNSAKYGSLWVPDGRVALQSSMSEEVLHLEWQEKDGPPVGAPLKQGFGLRLLSRALEQFGGRTEILFEPSGLVCRMKLLLPAGTKPDSVDSDSGQHLTAATT